MENTEKTPIMITSLKQNIFENAKYGLIFVTGDGRQAVLIGLYDSDKDGHYAELAVKNYGDFNSIINTYSLDGRYMDDFDNHPHMNIVGRYEKLIDENKLQDKILEEMGIVHFTGCLGTDPTQVELFEYAYKKGYNNGLKE